MRGDCRDHEGANPEVNMVSAPVWPRIAASNVAPHAGQGRRFDGYIKSRSVTAKRERSVAGTVFRTASRGLFRSKASILMPRSVRHMLYTTNEDTPGIIGTLGQTMGENGVNIANFTLGRAERGKDAIALLYVDDPIPAPTLDKLRATGLFQSVSPLEFEVS